MTTNKPKFSQDPERIDTAMGGAIIFAIGLVVGLILFLNLGPYRTFIFNVFFSWGWLDWLFLVPILGGLLRWSGNILSLLIGTSLFIGIQLAEIWPLVSMDSDKARTSDSWGEAMIVRVSVACVAYIADAIACVTFWPPLAVPFEQFRWAGLLGDIAWGNIGISFVTLFGLSAFVLASRWIARVM